MMHGKKNIKQAIVVSVYKRMSNFFICIRSKFDVDIFLLHSASVSKIREEQRARRLI
jgi:hypothetical protein